MPTVTHTFVSGIADDPTAAAAGEVLPSHWNANHTVSGVRTILTANTNYYVTVTGSDSNDGSLAHPWATLQHAMNFISASIDFAGFVVTVNIGAGSFVGIGIKSTLGDGILQWLGAGPASTTITQGDLDLVFNFGDCVSVNVAIDSVLAFDGMKFKVPADSAGLAIYTPAVLAQFGNYIANSVNNTVDMTLGTTASGIFFNTAASEIIVGAGTINVTGGGGSGSFAKLVVGAFLTDFGTWVWSGSFSATPYISGETSTYTRFTSGSHTGAGVTGQRFTLSSGSTASSDIASSGSPLGSTYFPGSTAGTCDSSSSYDGSPGTNLKYPQPTTTLRTTLTANTNYYVTTTGSDANDGSLAHPWATLQHACDFISGNLDLGGFTITVNVGAGSFVGFGFKSCVGGAFIQIIGAGSASTTIRGGPNDGTFNFGDCIDIEVVTETGLWVNGVTFAIPTNLAAFECDVFNGNIGLGIENSTALTDIIFAFPAGGGGGAININAGSIFTISPGNNQIAAIVKFDGTAGGTQSYAVGAGNYGFIINIAPWTITGTPAFSAAFTTISLGGLFIEDQVHQPSGAATGSRFSVSATGNISQNIGSALGPTWFPGNSPGTIADSVSSYDGYFGPLPAIDTQTGASYTLALSDAFLIVEMNNAGANTLTVPLNATVAFAIGTKIWVTQTGAGATTIAGAIGVTVHNAGVVGGQWKSVKLYKHGTDEWVQTNA